MAKRLPSIMPPLSLREALETTKIHSVAGKLRARLAPYGSTRPFRSPHHTVSPVAMVVGGGSNPCPAKYPLPTTAYSFSMNFRVSTLGSRSIAPAARRQAHKRVARPLPSRLPGRIHARGINEPLPLRILQPPTKTVPARPGSAEVRKPHIGPLLDRIDIQVEILPVPFDELSSRSAGEHSKQIRRRVRCRPARFRAARFAGEEAVHCNAQMNPRQIEAHCSLSAECTAILRRAMTKYDMSARAYDRILKVARTIADLDASTTIEPRHISEAIGYRNLDRGTWGATSATTPF